MFITVRCYILIVVTLISISIPHVTYAGTVKAQVRVYGICNGTTYGYNGVEVTIHGGAGGAIKGVTKSDGWTPPLGAVEADGYYEISAVQEGLTLLDHAQTKLSGGRAYIVVSYKCQPKTA